MNSPEDIRVETGLEVVQRPVVRGPRDLPCNYVNRLIGQRGIDDLFGLNQQEPVGDLDSHLIPPDLAVRHHLYDSLDLIVDRGAAPVRAQPAARPAQGLLEPRPVHRFEQVIHGVDLERFDRVLVERRHKNQCR